MKMRFRVAGVSRQPFQTTAPVFGVQTPVTATGLVVELVNDALDVGHRWVIPPGDVAEAEALFVEGGEVEVSIAAAPPAAKTKASK